MCSTLFLYISLPLFYTTTTWNFQKLLSYTFYGGNFVRVLVHFFFTAAHFHLALVAACNSHIVTAATKSLQKRKNSTSEESEGVWGGWGLRSSAAFSPPQSISLLASLAYFLPVSSRFLPFPPTTQPGPRLMLWWFYNKDQFKFKRLKDGRCTCKKTGSSHLNAGFLVVVATLWRHTVNDPINARGVFLILWVQAGAFSI